MLEKMEFKTKFGKTLLTAVQLKLKTGSIDDVYNLLDDLVSTVQDDQSEADNDYQVNNAEWNNQVADLTDSIDDLNADLNAQNSALIDFQQQQLDHQASYTELVQVGVELDDQNDALNDWWNKYQDDYSARQSERQRVLDALDTIISKLTERYNAGSFVQLKDLVSTMKAVKAQKNPILSLVQLTLSFNPTTVKTVIDRLSTVRDSVSEGASQDSEYFEYSKNVYTVQSSSLKQQIDDNTDSKNSEVVTLAGLRDSISETTDAISNDQNQLENDQDLLDSVTATQTTWNKKYDDDTQIRTEEVGVLQHVQEILSQNDSNLRQNED
jgi:hypothetical protein